MLLRHFGNWPAWNRGSLFDEFELLRRQMDRLAGSAGRGTRREPFAGVFPLVNITETPDAFQLRAELPGIKAEDLEISVTGNQLAISGERRLAGEPQGARYHRKERESGRFSRVVSLGAQIDTSKVEADSKDGILTVVLPKAEIAKPRQISVKVN
jgi:HSP20 family protein